MLKRLLIALAATAAASASHANNCEPIRAQIDAKYRAGGIQNFSLTIVDAAASAPGKVVGSCGNGSKRILFATPGQPGTPAAPPPAAPPPVTAPRSAGEKPILTECKDGTVSYGNCKK